MSDVYERTLGSLQALAEFNAKQDWIRQDIKAPSGIPVSAVPTLDGGEMPASPMLRARFAFGGRWSDANLGHDWLSVDEMKSLPAAKDIQAQIALRRKHWPQSLMARSYRSNPVALFGLDQEEQDETYLVWTRGPSEEPSVVRYSGHEEHIFENLLALVEHYLSVDAK